MRNKKTSKKKTSCGFLQCAYCTLICVSTLTLTNLVAVWIFLINIGGFSFATLY